MALAETKSFEDFVKAAASFDFVFNCFTKHLR